MTTKTHTDVPSGSIPLDSGGTIIAGLTVMPTDYTDLDLSPYIGARRCFVVLEFIRTGTTSDIWTRIRRDGETGVPEFYMQRSTIGGGNQDRPIELACMTSDQGRVEIASGDAAEVQVKLVAAVICQ